MRAADIHDACARHVSVTPPPGSDVSRGPGSSCTSLPNCVTTAPLSNMATTVMNKCLSPLALLTRRLSAPEFITQCCYHKKVVDHYENPRNVGSLDKNSRNVGTGLVGAPACGDVMKLQIEVDDQGKIVDARFKTFGCGSAIASSSLATEWVKGKSVDEALTIKNTDIARELSLPPVKLHCSMLAEDAIKAALADYRLKQQDDQQEAVRASI
ncbi:iron-sulfur cluster assembly scaffold protein IscU-like isoform X2 [Limanda limanda]|uniref:iron-sulfur cluster assembly scaffold protein IscU-like isoform X2 n=1 Tax=Limanda limanda TaxID=27771 RepID=UPI0029C7DD43|nr:iron-sulfur cluster assembly scaffold protein IscU-like isoform X2 [Limanda limanda]